ncbi:MAG: NADH-quinone oxidoreductase subunit J [Opitutales bacterium]
MTIAFYLFATVAVIGALIAVHLKNLVRAVFGLLLFFGSLAGLFLLLMAEFLAAVQVLVYIGAVGILMLFAIMLTHRVTGDDDRSGFSRGWIWGGLVSVLLFVGALRPVLDASRLAERSVTELAPSAKLLGERLMNPYTLTLEVTALLLTAALIGAIVLAKGTSEGRAGEGNKGS